MFKGMIKWIVIGAAALAVILAGVRIGRTVLTNFVSIRGQHLQSYRYSCGGGMDGGYESQSVKLDGDRALITVESAQWHSQDPTVTEYLTDPAVLEELEAVVRKHHMNFWHNKTFTNMFVYDGESESYSFSFDENSFFFSSQIYPQRYRSKLAELDRVLEKYIEAGERLPGLLNTDPDAEEYNPLEEGVLKVYVYTYAGNSLGLRISNGLDTPLEIPESFTILRADTGETIVEQETPYGGSFPEYANDEMHMKLPQRLGAGQYLLIFGDLEIPFALG